MPEDVKGDFDGLTDITDWEPPSDPEFPGTHYRRKLVALCPRDLSVSHNDDGISQRALGRTVGGPWQDIVGVATAPGLRLVLWASGDSFLLYQRHLRDTEQLFTVVDARAGDRLFTSSEDEILEG